MMNKSTIQLWQEMADMTNAKCQSTCKQMGQCCSSLYCEFAADTMTKAGYKFEELKPGKTFSHTGKCTVPPHFRILCSLQQCKISGLGFDPDDKEWTEKYFKLRDKLALLEMKLEAESGKQE